VKTMPHRSHWNECKSAKPTLAIVRANRIDVPQPGQMGNGSCPKLEFTLALPCFHAT
jgi:hypothetical protein